METRSKRQPSDTSARQKAPNEPEQSARLPRAQKIEHRQPTYRRAALDNSPAYGTLRGRPIVFDASAAIRRVAHKRRKKIETSFSA